LGDFEVWTDQAIDDLREIVAFISKDDPAAAVKLGEALIRKSKFPSFAENSASLYQIGALSGESRLFRAWRGPFHHEFRCHLAPFERVSGLPSTRE
jgi:plasmid stabilization system protein ParE